MAYLQDNSYCINLFTEKDAWIAGTHAANSEAVDIEIISKPFIIRTEHGHIAEMVLVREKKDHSKVYMCLNNFKEQPIANNLNYLHMIIWEVKPPNIFPFGMIRLTEGVITCK